MKRVSSDISLVEGCSENVPGLSQPQLYHQIASSHEASISVSSSASEKEDAGESGPGEQIQKVMDTHVQGVPEERRTMKRHT